MDRIRIVTGCGTQQELADFLGIKQSTVSEAKKRRAIPSDWLLTLLRKKGANPDWIVTGQGPKGLQPVECAADVTQLPVYIREVVPPGDCSIEVLVTEIARRVLHAMGKESRPPVP